MNKTTINLLCIIFLIILSASIIIPGVGMCGSFIAGVKDGATSVNKDVTALPGVPVEVTVNLIDFYPEALKDSITADNDKIVPITITKGMVTVPASNYNLKVSSVVLICALAEVVIFILLAIQVVKFVVNINRGVIFNRLNIKKLNKIGIYLLILAILQAGIGLAEDFAVSGMGITFEGMDITSTWSIPWSELLLGTMALLMAQVWNRGVQLKEDQELTI